MLQRRDVEDREGAKHAVHIPHTMLAAAIDRFGGPEVLTIHALPVPPVAPNEEHLAEGHVLGKTLLRIRHP